jgi:GNAT superfamily N-acetyltransferase
VGLTHYIAAATGSLPVLRNRFSDAPRPRRSPSLLGAGQYHRPVSLPDPQPPDSVRLAWPREAAEIAALQRRSWTAEMPAETSGPMLEAMSLEDMTAAWHTAIVRPPQAACRVLVAVEEGRVTGFATTGPSADEDAAPAEDGEIDQLVVDPAAQRRGHGSRLLNAAADTLRSDGFSRARCWVGTTDDRLRRFLTGAGWAADGASREIGSEDIPVRLRQTRMHTDLVTD